MYIEKYWGNYDLHEMVPDEDMQEMEQDCENLRKELCE